MCRGEADRQTEAESSRQRLGDGIDGLPDAPLSVSRPWEASGPHLKPVGAVDAEPGSTPASPARTAAPLAPEPQVSELPGGPSASSSTEPSERLRTQPPSPRCGPRGSRRPGSPPPAPAPHGQPPALKGEALGRFARVNETALVGSGTAFAAAAASREGIAGQPAQCRCSQLACSVAVLSILRSGSENPSLQAAIGRRRRPPRRRSCQRWNSWPQQPLAAPHQQPVAVRPWPRGSPG